MPSRLQCQNAAGEFQHRGFEFHEKQHISTPITRNLSHLMKYFSELIRGIQVGFINALTYNFSHKQVLDQTGL
jgi:hypothetical protein